MTIKNEFVETGYPLALLLSFCLVVATIEFQPEALIVVAILELSNPNSYGFLTPKLLDLMDVKS